MICVVGLEVRGCRLFCQMSSVVSVVTAGALFALVVLCQARLPWKSCFGRDSEPHVLGAQALAMSAAPIPVRSISSAAPISGDDSGGTSENLVQPYRRLRAHTARP